jgi:hypothetical protein
VLLIDFGVFVGMRRVVNAEIRVTKCPQVCFISVVICCAFIDHMFYVELVVGNETLQ